MTGHAFKPIIAALLLVLCRVAANGAPAETLPQLDFAGARSALNWTAAHDVAPLAPGQDGLRISITGTDPYIIGPAQDYPAGQVLWLSLKVKSEQGGSAQVFYFQASPTELASVRFHCRPGVWEDIHVPLPALGPGFHLRFDPPGDSGACTLARMAFAPRLLFKEPDWPPPDPPVPPDARFTVQSGDTKITVASSRWNDFIVEVAGKQMAIGYTRPLIGIVENGTPRWIDIANMVQRGSARRNGNLVLNTITLSEGSGTAWHIVQKFAPAAVPGAIDLETTITVDRDQNVLYLPMFVLLPGCGSFGSIKDHALFAGLEYLDGNEPSSSEADIIGPGSHRQVPDSIKSTLPLMAIQADERYIGLAWTPDPAFCALFDSPDRRFHSLGHVMGILYPGSDGSNREAGSLLPYETQTLKANVPLVLRAVLLGGRANNIVPAVQQYVALRGLPPLPQSGIDRAGYVNLGAAGWLRSGISEGGKYRHAMPGSFAPQPAGDAAMLQEWLAQQTRNEAPAALLRGASRLALAQVPPDALNSSGIGHIRSPAPALFYGHVAENADRARDTARGLLAQFAPDGTVFYRHARDRPDFGRTHFASDANGLTAQVVSALLEQAVFSGDAALIQEGVRVLRALDKFYGSAPRGAQTWEVPLHTPDILASANLVRAYTLGYALTGEPHLLDQARYWAWTGVPFVYLTPPNGLPSRGGSGGPVAPVTGDKRTDPVGTYATIAVYGATGWIAPDWMGVPVQWCGLVYADALYRLYKYDANPVWKTLADGITISGIQQTWPAPAGKTRQGLLPDSFNLRLQTQNDPAINPGTLEADAVQYLTGIPLYDCEVFRTGGLVSVHAPGAVRMVKQEPHSVSFQVEGWPRRPYFVLINGLKSAPGIRVNDRPVTLTGANTFNAETGRLILQLDGKSNVTLIELAF